MKPIFMTVWDSPNTMGNRITKDGWRLLDVLPLWNLDMAWSIKAVLRQ